MKPNTQSIKLLLLSSLAMLLLAACSSNQSTTDSHAANNTQGATSSPTAEVKQVELEVWGRWEEMLGQMEETIAEFQQQHPHIKVKYTNVPGSQYVAQIQAAISGNTLPDIIGYHQSIPTSLLVNLDVLHPLDDVLTAEQKAEYYEGTWSEGYTLIDGQTYAIPVFNPKRPAMMLYYNKEALHAAGLTEDDIPATWDELYSFSKQVQQNTDGKLYGLVIGVKELSFLSGAISQMATAITPDVSPTDLFNYRTGQYEYHAQGIVQGLELFKKLQDEKLLHPSSLVMSFREGTALMEEGQAVLTIDGSFYASQLNADKLGSFGVAPLPTKDGKPQYAAFQGESRVAFYVSKHTEHYEETKLFLQFIKEHLYPKLVADGVEYSPLPAVNEATTINHPVAAEALRIQDEVSLLIPRPFERNADSLKVVLETSGKLPKTTLGNIAEGYLTGQIKDVEAALLELSQQANQVLEEGIAKVNAAGGSITLDDYAFADWVPYQPYQ